MFCNLHESKFDRPLVPIRVFKTFISNKKHQNQRILKYDTFFLQGTDYTLFRLDFFAQIGNSLNGQSCFLNSSLPMKGKKLGQLGSLITVQTNEQKWRKI